MGVDVGCGRRYSNYPMFCELPEGHESIWHEGHMPEHVAEVIGCTPLDTFTWVAPGYSRDMAQIIRSK